MCQYLFLVCKFPVRIDCDCEDVDNQPMGERGEKKGLVGQDDCYDPSYEGKEMKNRGDPVADCGS